MEDLQNWEINFMKGLQEVIAVPPHSHIEPRTTSPAPAPMVACGSAPRGCTFAKTAMHRKPVASLLQLWVTISGHLEFTGEWAPK